MKPAPFEYHRAESADHALALLERHGEDARLLAGGQSLVPMMNLRLARPEVIIDIGRIEQRAVVATQTAIEVGCMTPHRALLADPAVAAAAPLVPEAVRYIAHPTVRNRGTAGGSIAHADPTAELSALLLLLDGEVEARSAQGARRIAAADFFRAAFTTSLAPTEMVFALRFNLPRRPWGGCFLELAERHGDFAIAAVAVALGIEEGRVGEARIVLSGAESVPVRAAAAEALLRGEAPTPALAREAARAAVEGHDAYADIRATAEYRRHLLTALTEQAVATAWARTKEDR